MYINNSIFQGGRVSSWCNPYALQNCSKRVCTVVAQLRSLSGKYPWKRYEALYPPSYGLNSTTTVLLGEWLWHWITYKVWYAIKQRNQTKPYFNPYIFFNQLLHQIKNSNCEKNFKIDLDDFRNNSKKKNLRWHFGEL